MKYKRGLILSFLVLAGFVTGVISLAHDNRTVNASPITKIASQPGDYILLAWNDLGMHCYNVDFADLAVLPPYNTLWAQVIQSGETPRIITEGIEVTYEFPDNTYSVGKTNFWTYAQDLFGLAEPLPANIGLTGRGLAGPMDRHGDHFVAEGIPVTEFSDSAPDVPDPYQVALIKVLDLDTHQVLAQAEVVAPVSSEMRCDNCHDDDGIATVGEITPTGKVETNILTLHDHENLASYPPGMETPLMESRPVLCASCHASNALGTAGVTGVPNLSRAMHDQHEDVTGITPDINGCYNCHPGPVTQCLRDVMATQGGMDCIDCHGKMEQVANNPNPWLNEPRCDSCHEGHTEQTHPLYRMSVGHNGIYCAGCHDSPHAVAPSREPDDGLKFMALQGTTSYLEDCSVCHVDTMSGEPFPHDFSGFPLYLPLLQNQQ